MGVPLVDLLDRVLATGVVVSGDLVIAVADVPLIRLSLHALLSSVSDRVPGSVDGRRPPVTVRRARRPRGEACSATWRVGPGDRGGRAPPDWTWTASRWAGTWSRWCSRSWNCCVS